MSVSCRTKLTKGVTVMDCTGMKAVYAAAENGNVSRMLRDMGFEVECASDGAQALALCDRMRPDIVAAEAVLPVLDGFALAKRIRRLDIPRLPGVIVLRLPIMGRGCALPGTAEVDKPVDMQMLCDAINAVRVECRVPDDGMKGRMGEILDMLGIPEGRGREYLADAAFLAAEDAGLLKRLTAGLYPLTAKRAGTDAKAVERAMRRAIEQAWSTGSMEAQYRIFKNTIDAARGKPTCGEMIARLSELLRREG